MVPNDTIFYPTDDIRAASAKISSKANLALESHHTAWARIQRYVESFPGFMQGPIMDVLSRYERRLSASYQWQIDFAQTLGVVANAIDTNEQDIASGF